MLSILKIWLSLFWNFLILVKEEKKTRKLKSYKIKTHKFPICIIKTIQLFLNLAHDFKDTHLYFLSTWKWLCYCKSIFFPHSLISRSKLNLVITDLLKTEFIYGPLSKFFSLPPVHLKKKNRAIIMTYLQSRIRHMFQASEPKIIYINSWRWKLNCPYSCSASTFPSVLPSNMKSAIDLSMRFSALSSLYFNLKIQS